MYVWSIAVTTLGVRYVVFLWNNAVTNQDRPKAGDGQASATQEKPVTAIGTGSLTQEGPEPIRKEGEVAIIKN